MRFGEFAAWLSRVERSYPVADWRIDGVEVWPMVRLNLYHRNFNPPSPPAGSRIGAYVDAGMRVARHVGGWVGARVGDSGADRPREIRADAVFLTYSIGAQPEMAGRRVNPLTHPYVSLVEAAGRSALVWEASPYAEYNTPRFTPSALIQPWILADRVLSRLAAPDRNAATIPEFEDLAVQVKDTALRWDYADRGVLARDAHYVRRLANRFKDWLSKIRPIVGFTADYGFPEQAFCLACHEVGALPIEIQHGVQSRTHAAYGMWSAIPAGGYQTLPSGYWCWSSEASRTINEWARPAGISPGAIAAGNPWMSAWENPGSEGSGSMVAQSLDEELARQGASREKGLDVLLALTCVGDVLPPILRETLTRAPSAWRVWARLHPVNQSQQRSALEREAASVGISVPRAEIATRALFPDLLRRMDVQVVVGPSTVIMQAAEQGIGSVVIGVGGGEAEQLFPSEFANGMLKFASSPEELIHAVNDLAGKRGSTISGGSSRSRMIATMKALLERGESGASVGLGD